MTAVEQFDFGVGSVLANSRVTAQADWRLFTHSCTHDVSCGFVTFFCSSPPNGQQKVVLKSIYSLKSQVSNDFAMSRDLGSCLSSVVTAGLMMLGHEQLLSAIAA